MGLTPSLWCAGSFLRELPAVLILHHLGSFVIQSIYQKFYSASIFGIEALYFHALGAAKDIIVPGSIAHIVVYKMKFPKDGINVRVTIWDGNRPPRRIFPK